MYTNPIHDRLTHAIRDIYVRRGSSSWEDATAAALAQTPLLDLVTIARYLIASQLVCRHDRLILQATCTRLNIPIAFNTISFVAVQTPL